MFPLGQELLYGPSGKMNVDSWKIRGTQIYGFSRETKCQNLGDLVLQESTVRVLEVRNQRVGQAAPSEVPGQQAFSVSEPH